jgi:hypothetical protein
MSLDRALAEAAAQSIQFEPRGLRVVERGYDCRYSPSRNGVWMSGDSGSLGSHLPKRMRWGFGVSQGE